MAFAEGRGSFAALARTMASVADAVKCRAAEHATTLALWAIAAVAAVTYCWGIGAVEPEIFYAAAARSMSTSWHNFFFAAFDPEGTVSVDKLPGAFWIQAVSVRIFGPHVWAVMLPQAIEGVLTILVLHRAVRRIAGPVAGLVAAAAMTCTPVTVALNRGNISDTLLILLLVLAADTMTTAILANRPRWLLLTGLLVGLAFQAKMIQAWLILPVFLFAWLVGTPAGRWRQRAGWAAAMIAVAGAVSFSWIGRVAHPRRSAALCRCQPTQFAVRAGIRLQPSGSAYDRGTIGPRSGEPVRSSSRRCGWALHRLARSDRTGLLDRVDDLRHTSPRQDGPADRRAGTVGLLADRTRRGIPHRGHRLSVLPGRIGPVDRRDPRSRGSGVRQA
ncbi:hypothetical protein F6W96_35030 [Nocardia terpenica]|uniref:Glycosyltransferase RgtA/B/C/D-like domain-containing protein n=1 Tax=Nocardia terpenica TaxID=455432 RepID=A0A6G9ZBH8_9NOCA|nr:hypothetical protein F6W96_35030 [Nocardia terpenica]